MSRWSESRRRSAPTDVSTTYGITARSRRRRSTRSFLPRRPSGGSENLLPGVVFVLLRPATWPNGRPTRRPSVLRGEQFENTHENTFGRVVTVGLSFFSNHFGVSLWGEDNGSMARSTHVPTRYLSTRRKVRSQMVVMSRFAPLPFPTIRRLADGLLPAGKEQHDRRTNLNNTTATTAVGGHA
jgi:hypothetical protein